MQKRKVPVISRKYTKYLKLESSLLIKHYKQKLSWTIECTTTPALSCSTFITQGIDGSARKPALRKDTGYMVEKTYLDIAPYLGFFGAYVMPQ